MTQTYDPTIPAPPITPAPPPVVSLTDRVLIASELGKTIEEARTIIGSLRQFTRLIFNTAQGDTDWTVGSAIPGKDDLLIFAAFNADFVSEDTDGLDRATGDCRFYVIPANGVTDPLAPVFCCFVLNRSFPAVVGEQMTLETFVREVGREWYNLAVVQGVVEEEVRLTREEWEELEAAEEED